MDFDIAPKLLLDALKRLMPHKSSLLRKGPLVMMRAEGDALDATGQFERILEAFPRASTGSAVAPWISLH
jgi:hypothetical protein